jgi:phage repressor protein C with HTH and peptisase S24 domain
MHDARRQDGASAPRRIPLYRSIEAAGYAAPVLGEDFDYIVDHGDVPPGAEFAVRIRDDSLEPVLHSGSVAYLNHDPLHAGDVGIFCVGGDMLCKQYYRDPLGVSYLFSLGRDRGADVVCGPESGKRFICFGHVILDHRVPLPGMGL